MWLCGVLEVMVEIASPGYPHNTHTGIMCFFITKVCIVTWLKGHTCSLNSLQHRPDAFSNIH